MSSVDECLSNTLISTVSCDHVSNKNRLVVFSLILKPTYPCRCLTQGAANRYRSNQTFRSLTGHLESPVESGGPRRQGEEPCTKTDPEKAQVRSPAPPQEVLEEAVLESLISGGVPAASFPEKEKPPVTLTTTNICFPTPFRETGVTQGPFPNTVVVDYAKAIRTVNQPDFALRYGP